MDDDKILVNTKVSLFLIFSDHHSHPIDEHKSPRQNQFFWIVSSFVDVYKDCVSRDTC